MLRVESPRGLWEQEQRTQEQNHNSMTPELPDSIKNRTWTTKEVILIAFILIIGAIEYSKYQNLSSDLVKLHAEIEALRKDLSNFKELYHEQH